MHELVSAADRSSSNSGLVTVFGVGLLIVILSLFCKNRDTAKVVAAVGILFLACAGVYMLLR